MRAPDEGGTLRELAVKLGDAAKTYARAEIAVGRQMALHWVRVLSPSAAMVVVAVFLVQASLTVAIAALGMTIAIWLGPAGGLAVAAVVGLAIAALLAKIALSRLGRGS